MQTWDRTAPPPVESPRTADWDEARAESIGAGLEAVQDALGVESLPAVLLPRHIFVVRIISAY